MPKKKWPILASALLFAANCFAAPAPVRLYALDCGLATFKDMGGFSDTGEYDGQSGEVAGLGDHFAAPAGGTDVAPGVASKDYQALPKPPAFLDSPQ